MVLLLVDQQVWFECFNKKKKNVWFEREITEMMTCGPENYF